MAERPVRRTKLSDVIVQDIKRLIVAEQLKPGDRVMGEQDLVRTYSCSKGTAREAMKALQVEGLVVTRTGPGGGAYLADADAEPAARMLRAYLHFRHIDGEGVYQLRKIIEPELAASAAGHLSDALFLRLEENIRLCAKRPESEDEQHRQRVAELEFHNILAEACPNPLLAFMGSFLNDMLRDLVVLKRAYLPERHQFGEANVQFHEDLLAALRREDKDAVRSIMRRHMGDAENHMCALEGEVEQTFLLDFPRP